MALHSSFYAERGAPSQTSITCVSCASVYLVTYTILRYVRTRTWRGSASLYVAGRVALHSPFYVERGSLSNTNHVRPYNVYHFTVRTHVIGAVRGLIYCGREGAPLVLLRREALPLLRTKVTCIRIVYHMLRYVRT